MEQKPLMVCSKYYYVICKRTDHDYVSAAFLSRGMAEMYVEDVQMYGDYIVMSAEEAQKHYQVIF